jgi:hypothetical protein
MVSKLFTVEMAFGGNGHYYFDGNEKLPTDTSVNVTGFGVADDKV